MPAAIAVAALVQSVTQLQLLQQLSALTSLSASALADEGLSALAQLRRLRHLDIERAKGLTVPGMSLLTAMTGLTELRGPALAAPFSASHHGRLVHLRSRTVSSVLLGWQARGHRVGLSRPHWAANSTSLSLRCNDLLYSRGKGPSRLQQMVCTHRNVFCGALSPAAATCCHHPQANWCSYFLMQTGPEWQSAAGRLVSALTPAARQLC